MARRQRSPESKFLFSLRFRFLTLVGYTLGTTTVHTLTIADNDGNTHLAGTATVSVSDVQGYKAWESITFTVSVNRVIDAETEPMR